MDAIAAVDCARLRREFRRGRRRSPVVALDGVDLRIPTGEVHGLLGPNGAGKTTLCKILSTVLLPSAGRASVLGHDVVADTGAVRARIGIVFGGEKGLYPRLTARHNLRYWGALHRLPRRKARDRTEELLARVGLADRADEPVEGFSRGMRQRLHLARGLLGDPPVLLLDEPTTGMDPVAAREFRGLVDALRGEGRTLLVTTHDMAEAEAICDRVTLIDQGRLLATEPPRTLSSWIAAYERVEIDGAPAPVLDEIADVDGVAEVRRTENGRARVETAAEGVAAKVVAHLAGRGVTSVTIARPSLEEVYLHVYGQRGLQV